MIRHGAEEAQQSYNSFGTVFAGVMSELSEVKRNAANALRAINTPPPRPASDLDTAVLQSIPPASYLDS